MGKGYSQYLRGDCLNTPENNNMALFKTVNAHLVFSSPECTNQRTSGFFACGSYPFLVPPVNYTEQIPQNYIPPGDTIVYGKLYGKSQDTTPITLKDLKGNDVYFNSTEIQPWLPVPYCPMPYNIYQRSGPAFTNCHCYGAMVRRLANNNNYENRANYEWVDAAMQLPYSGYAERFPVCGEGCTTTNWLIMSNPAMPMWTSNDNPLVITTHYEQSGYNCPSNASNGGNLYIPFCAPMNVREADGNLLGQYTGIGFSLIYGQGSIVFPTRPYLPPDEWSPVPPPNTPEVNPRRAFWSLEVSYFFRGTSVDPVNKPLGSPLIGKMRFYLYSLAPGGPGQSRDWRFPFRILFQQSIYGDFRTPIELNVLTSPVTTQVINVNMTNMKALVTY